MSDETRGSLLADLAGAVNELVEPRTHTEYVETTVTEEVPAGRRRKSKRTRRRVAHTTTLPSLLDSLAEAMVPGATGEGDGSAGFESRPSADLEPVAVLREITTDATTWGRALLVNRSTLPGLLRGLVGAQHSDSQLRNLVYDARRWVRRARLATGFDAAPFTLNEPCPYCFRRHALVITADMQKARCSRCGTSWAPDTIGLLADMLTMNQEQETATMPACWMTDCTRLGVHTDHEDNRGHSWGDTCELSDPNGRLSA